MSRSSSASSSIAKNYSPHPGRERERERPEHLLSSSYLNWFNLSHQRLALATLTLTLIIIFQLLLQVNIIPSYSTSPSLNSPLPYHLQLGLDQHRDQHRSTERSSSPTLPSHSSRLGRPTSDVGPNLPCRSSTGPQWFGTFTLISRLGHRPESSSPPPSSLQPTQHSNQPSTSLSPHSGILSGSDHPEVFSSFIGNS